jgi:uridine phosphorylase
MKGIVQPVVTARTPRLPSRGVLVATRSDMQPLAAALHLTDVHPRALYMSQLYAAEEVFLAGPFMGAPSAVMILENLAVWGGREFIFMGWCGAISPQIHIGDILVPALAWIDEGTSPSYLPFPADSSRPSPSLTGRIQQALNAASLPFHQGAVWTTDAIFRETPEKVQHYQGKGALAVEMELSALFTVAEYLKARIAAVLVVSDDLSSLTWKPGFREKAFIENRKQVARCIHTIVKYPPVTEDY